MSSDHGDLKTLPDLEKQRDAAYTTVRSGYDDADIFRNEREFHDHTLRPMFVTTPAYYIFVLALALVMANGVAFFVIQTIEGMGNTGMREPLFWGTYIATFVFWVAFPTLERSSRPFYV